MGSVLHLLVVDDLVFFFIVAAAAAFAFLSAKFPQ